MRSRLQDMRLWALLGAVLLTGLTFLVPRLSFERNVYDLVAVIDITGSMNTRDMSVGGQPQSRIEAAKAALSQLLADLPCQSRLGLGVFTERRSFLLFNPIDVCAGFAPIEAAIASIDWRMGWEGDSFVAKGLYSALDIAGSLPADLVFMTDGQEAPPLPPGQGVPPFESEVGRVKGLVIGVGGTEKVPLPKFDDEGHEVGIYGPQDVVQENRTGAPPPDAEKRPGYHPKWAPFGSGPPEGDEHLTSVRSAHLQTLASVTGLGYAELARTPVIVNSVLPNAKPRQVVVPVDIRGYLAAGALALLAALYAAPLVSIFRSTLFSRKQEYTHDTAPHGTRSDRRVHRGGSGHVPRTDAAKGRRDHRDLGTAGRGMGGDQIVRRHVVASGRQQS